MLNHDAGSVRLRFGLVLALLSTAGCYTFRPVTPPESGMDVRATLNVDAAIRRSQGLDDPIRYVDGRIVEYGPDAVSLDVLVARSASVFQEVVIRDTVRLMTSEIESILARRLSVARTVLFGTIGVGGAVMLIAGISSIVGGNDDEPPDGNEAIVVPVFSLGSFRSIRVLGITVRR